MAPKKPAADDRTPFLLDPGPAVELPPPEKPIKRKVWTEHKAQLIERYLYYFVQVTKHGAYIDGFAGPQSEVDGEVNWSARRVMESQPRHLQKFFLFEKDAAQQRRLRDLINRQPRKHSKEPTRRMSIYRGDFNETLPKLLSQGLIRPREATFALLDQRSCECHWKSVEALAAHKPPGENKIELFYFLANHWLERTLANTKEEGKLEAWWGAPGWEALRGMHREERAALLVQRLRKDLKYKYARPYPIYQREEREGFCMYYMIHASDHPAASQLMLRAYDRVLKPKEDFQMKFATFDDLLKATDDGTD
ncbi:MAG: three-Cys-motif partner protein TcmP [Spirochaetaceae bacterium]|nr:three-Cys-motif partner protein TcmP [Spirochaetaceae bacterium]